MLAKHLSKYNGKSYIKTNKTDDHGVQAVVTDSAWEVKATTQSQRAQKYDWKMHPHSLG